MVGCEPPPPTCATMFVFFSQWRTAASFKGSQAEPAAGMAAPSPKAGSVGFGFGRLTLSDL